VTDRLKVIFENQWKSVFTRFIRVPFLRASYSIFTLKHRVKRLFGTPQINKL